MKVEEFVNRIDEAEKVLKYTFRHNLQQPKIRSKECQLKKLQIKNADCWLKRQQNRHTECLRRLFLTDGMATRF